MQLDEGGLGVTYQNAFRRLPPSVGEALERAAGAELYDPATDVSKLAVVGPGMCDPGGSEASAGRAFLPGCHQLGVVKAVSHSAVGPEASTAFLARTGGASGSYLPFIDGSGETGSPRGRDPSREPDATIPILTLCRATESHRAPSAAAASTSVG
jgi:hypothetical protein